MDAPNSDLAFRIAQSWQEAMGERRAHVAMDGAVASVHARIRTSRPLLGEAYAFLLSDDELQVSWSADSSEMGQDVMVVDVDERSSARPEVGSSSAAGSPCVLLCAPSWSGGQAVAAAIGAVGWLSRDLGASELRETLLRLGRDGLLEPRRSKTSNGRHAPATSDALHVRYLTGRELEVIELLQAGGTTDGIARDLGLSPLTVRTHLQNAMSKLNVSSRIEAVATIRRARQTALEGPSQPTTNAAPGVSADDDAPSVMIAIGATLDREALGAVLAARGDVLLLASSPDAASVIFQSTRRSPDVVLVSNDVPGGGAAACAAVKRQTEARVLLLHDARDEATLLASVEAGADGFVAADESVDGLVSAIRTVSGGHAFIPPEMLAGLLRGLIHRRRDEDVALERFGRLSGREREVLAALVEGLDHEAIVARLVVSPHTARTHIQNVMKKLEVHTRLEAVALANRFELVERFGGKEGRHG